MKRGCSTCVHKEGSCYPSTTIFDKDKTCKSYVPDYEGYITDLEKENAELKEQHRVDLIQIQAILNQRSLQNMKLAKAKELLKDIVSSYSSTEVSEAQLYLKIKKAELFLNEVDE